MNRKLISGDAHRLLLPTTVNYMCLLFTIKCFGGALNMCLCNCVHDIILVILTVNMLLLKIGLDSLFVNTARLHGFKWSSICVLCIFFFPGGNEVNAHVVTSRQSQLASRGEGSPCGRTLDDYYCDPPLVCTHGPFFAFCLPRVNYQVPINGITA